MKYRSIKRMTEIAVAVMFGICAFNLVALVGKVIGVVVWELIKRA